MTQLRFALAQIDTCVGALDANAAKVLDYSRKAAAGNAQVVVFPEMTLTGYPIEDLALRRTFRQAAWDKANELATQLNDDGLGDLFVVVGTVGTDRKTSKPRNRLVVLHQGVVWAGYDKHFLPNYGVFDEFRIFSAGDRSVTLDVDGATIGGSAAAAQGQRASPRPRCSPAGSGRGPAPKRTAGCSISRPTSAQQCTGPSAVRRSRCWQTGRAPDADRRAGSACRRAAIRDACR